MQPTATTLLSINASDLAYFLGKQSQKAARAYSPATQAKIAALFKQRVELTSKLS